MKRPAQRLVLGATVAFLTVALQAATIMIEPDDYVGDLSGVAPGARLVTVRGNSSGTGYVFQKAYSVEGGSWSPTGTRVFGHSVLSPGELAYHWDNLAGPNGAWDCYAFDNCGTFKVFGVYFGSPARSVTIQTTIRGEQGLDPVELWAFDTNGDRVLQCKLNGVASSDVLQSGVLPPPRYYNLPFPTRANVCGEVLEKKNCSASPYALPGDCDYVVEMRVERKLADIGFVWFGGKFYYNSHANVDALSYTVQ
jgi:hypothetical protein